MKQKRFECLDGLRGLCAFIVAVMHCDLALNSGHLLNHGYLCVDAFFVLSGFVIALTYQGRLEGGLSPHQFLLARAYRLVPIHWIGTILASSVLLLTVVTGRFALSDSLSALSVSAALSLILVPTFQFPTGFLFPANPVLWSLLDEWIVNIGYGMGLFRLKTKTLSGLILLSWLVLAAYGFTNRYGLDVGQAQANFILGIIRGFGGFLSGAVIYRLYADGKLNRLPSISPGILYSLCFLATAIPTSTATPAFDLFVMMVLPIFVAVLVRSERPMPSIFNWLGAVSYPLYVSQMTVIGTAAILLGQGRHNLLLAVPILLAALLLAHGITALIAMAPRSRIVPADQ